MLLTTVFALLLLRPNLVVTEEDLLEPPIGWQVDVSEGRLDGAVKMVLGKEIGTFLGVPFARAPLAELRFAPPQPADKWKGGKHAGQLAPACTCQSDSTWPGFRGSEMWNPSNTRVTEDCLYLNIWAPKGAKGASVLVWIFGGGFVSGSPSLEIYDGSVLAATNDVVVVSIGYRTGPFGFLYFDHPEAPGNVGLLDQQMALKWISRNIQQFGGDAAKVTLFGESAGAAAVSAHLFAPGSRNLFRFAILQSGAITNRWAHLTTSKALDYTNQLLKLVDCDSAEDKLNCLRQVPADKLSLKSSELGVATGFFDYAFGPVVADKNFFKGDFRDKLARGQFKKTSILAGINTDEGSYWLPFHLSEFVQKDSHQLHGKAKFLEAIGTLFPSAKPTVHRAIGYEYLDIPDCSKVDPFRQAVNQIYGDFYFSCDLISFTQQLVSHGAQVYQYHFDQRIANNPWPEWMGVMHGYEIEYIFGAPLLNSTVFNESEVEFSRQMMSYWSDFAKNGKPSAEQHIWYPYTLKEQNYTYLRISFEHPMKHLKREKCNFWSSLTTADITGIDQSTSSSTTVFHYHSSAKLLLTTMSLLTLMYKI